VCQGRRRRSNAAVSLSPHQPLDIGNHIKASVRLDQATAADAVARLIAGHGGKISRAPCPIGLFAPGELFLIDSGG
jgi:hypothetical protein